jgi:hypothetical protein
MQRSQEVKLGELITQDISDPSPFWYVYRTPEQAVSSEVHYTSRELTGKLSQKTVVKVKCWGNCNESTRKWAFSQMMAVENIGMVKENISVIRATSKMRNTKQGSQRREISPRGVKGGKMNSPGRVYASVVARKASPVYKNSVNFFKDNSTVKELLRKMQEDTEKIEKDFLELEKFNDFLKFEDLDTDRSLKRVKS